MTVAVTGASGHIGANLVRMLKDSGRDVRAMVHRNTRALDGLDVALIHGDVLNPSSVRQLFCGAQVVYHLAGVITLRSRTNDSALSTNVEGVRNVIDACRACGVKFLVHFSSIHAFSETPADGVVDEQRPLCRDEDALPYDRSKAAGEQIVREAVAAGLPAVIINPTAVLGPHDYKPSAMGRVLLDLCRGRLPVLVQGGFNWVDVRDVCGAAIRAENLRAAGRQYLVGGQYLALKEFADLVGEVTGRRSRRFVVPPALARLGVPFAGLAARAKGREPLFTAASLRALQQHRSVSHERARQELGYYPRPLRETIRDAFAWFKEMGWL